MAGYIPRREKHAGKNLTNLTRKHGRFFGHHLKTDGFDAKSVLYSTLR